MPNLAEKYPNLNLILDELFEAAGNLKLAMKDGELEPGELVAAIPDPEVQEYLRTILGALKGLPAEVNAVAESGPWNMMMLFQELASKVMKIFK